MSSEVIPFILSTRKGQDHRNTNKDNSRFSWMSPDAVVQERIRQIEKYTDETMQWIGKELLLDHKFGIPTKFLLDRKDVPWLSGDHYWGLIRYIKKNLEKLGWSVKLEHRYVFHYVRSGGHYWKDGSPLGCDNFDQVKIIVTESV